MGDEATEVTDKLPIQWGEQEVISPRSDASPRASPRAGEQGKAFDFNQGEGMGEPNGQPNGQLNGQLNGQPNGQPNGVDGGDALAEGATGKDGEDAAAAPFSPSKAPNKPGQHVKIRTHTIPAPGPAVNKALTPAGGRGASVSTPPPKIGGPPAKKKGIAKFRSKASVIGRAGLAMRNFLDERRAFAAADKVQTAANARKDLLLGFEERAKEDEKKKAPVVPYHLQGNQAFLRHGVAMIRKGLADDETIQFMTEKFWMACPKPKGNDKSIKKKAYVMLHMRMTKAIHPAFADDEAKQCANDEWLVDNTECKYHPLATDMSRKDLEKAVFDVADTWTDSLHPQEYANFLLKLYLRMTKPADGSDDSDFSLADIMAQDRRFKPLTEIDLIDIDELEYMDEEEVGELTVLSKERKAKLRALRRFGATGKNGTLAGKSGSLFDLKKGKLTRAQKAQMNLEAQARQARGGHGGMAGEGTLGGAGGPKLPLSVEEAKKVKEAEREQKRVEKAARRAARAKAKKVKIDMWEIEEYKEDDGNGGWIIKRRKRRKAKRRVILADGTMMELDYGEDIPEGAVEIARKELEGDEANWLSASDEEEEEESSSDEDSDGTGKKKKKKKKKKRRRRKKKAKRLKLQKDIKRMNKMKKYVKRVGESGGEQGMGIRDDVNSLCDEFDDAKSRLKALLDTEEGIDAARRQEDAAMAVEIAGMGGVPEEGTDALDSDEEWVNGKRRRRRQRPRLPAREATPPETPGVHFLDRPYYPYYPEMDTSEDFGYEAYVPKSKRVEKIFGRFERSALYTGCSEIDMQTLRNMKLDERLEKARMRRKKKIDEFDAKMNENQDKILERLEKIGQEKDKQQFRNLKYVQKRPSYLDRPEVKLRRRPRQTHTSPNDQGLVPSSHTMPAGGLRRGSLTERASKAATQSLATGGVKDSLTGGAPHLRISTKLADKDAIERGLATHRRANFEPSPPPPRHSGRALHAVPTHPALVSDDEDLRASYPRGFNKRRQARKTHFLFPPLGRRAPVHTPISNQIYGHFMEGSDEDMTDVVVTGSLQERVVLEQEEEVVCEPELTTKEAAALKAKMATQKFVEGGDKTDIVAKTLTTRQLPTISDEDPVMKGFPPNSFRKSGRIDVEKGYVRSRVYDNELNKTKNQYLTNKRGLAVGGDLVNPNRPVQLETIRPTSKLAPWDKEAGSRAQTRHGHSELGQTRRLKSGHHSMNLSNAPIPAAPKRTARF